MNLGARGSERRERIFGSPQIVPLSSAKTGKASWTPAGWNEGSEEGTFTVYAYCEKKN